MSRTRPRLALRVGEDLVGTPPHRATPRAVAVLSTVHGGTTFTWEEWQLLAHDGSDVWIEYDHDTRDVTLLHPTEAWPPVVDLSGLRTGSTLGLRLDGRQHSLVVRERDDSHAADAKRPLDAVSAIDDVAGLETDRRQ